MFKFVQNATSFCAFCVVVVVVVEHNFTDHKATKSALGICWTTVYFQIFFPLKTQFLNPA